MSKNSNRLSAIKRLRVPAKKPAVLVTVLVIVLAAWLLSRSSLFGSAGRPLDKNLYQSVFLTNGQVYFGKITNLKGEYLDMSNVYYLQTQESNQQGDAVANLESSADIKLIKLGNELHGPTDRMLINKDQILFWENMQEDSKVSQAIKQYQEENQE